MTYFASVEHAGTKIVQMELDREQFDCHLDTIVNIVYLYCNDISENFPVKITIETLKTFETGEETEIDTFVDAWTFTTHKDLKAFQDKIFKPDFFRK